MAGNKTTLSERLCVKVFDGATWLNQKRESYQVTAQIVTGIVTMALVALLYVIFFDGVKTDASASQSAQTFWQRFAAQMLTPKFGLSILVAVIFNRGLLNGVLPTLEYARQSIAMRTMGLERIIVDDDKYSEIVTGYMKRHEATRECPRIRVICISGHFLFRASTMPNGKPAPLHEAARNGLLDIIMPEGVASNPTIEARFGTYTDAFKEQSNLKEVTDLLQDVEHGKAFLRKFSGNIISEHSMLCMWRVVLFSQHCIVQSYFPNSEGHESYTAPVFVFRKTDSAFSYYSVFEEMFKMVKRHGSVSDTTLPG